MGEEEEVGVRERRGGGEGGREVGLRKGAAGGGKDDDGRALG